MHADTVPSTTNQVRFLRLPAVCARTGLSRSHIHRLEADGRFPRRVKLTPAASAWIESEIDVWASRRVAASRGGDA